MKKSILLSCFLFLAGCATTKPNYFVQTISDTVDGMTVYRAEDNKVGYPDKTGCRPPHCDILYGSERDDCDFQLGVQKAISKDRTDFMLIVNYENRDWFFIGPGESLVMKVDGKRIGFRGGWERE